MTKALFICLTLFFITNTTITAQLSDLARIEYVGLPESSNGGASFNRYRALINYPIKLKKEGSYFVVGLDYRYISFNVDETLLNFESEELSEFKQLSLSLGYTYKINKDWRFGAQIQPGYSTNLEVSDITFNDATFSGSAIFLKDKRKDIEDGKKPYRLILGLRVSGNGGFPILPFISYFKKFAPKWSYNLGVPKTQLQYHLNEKNRLKLVARIDGFRSRLQNDIIVQPNGANAEIIRQRLIVSGLRYEYKFTKHLEFYFNGSYILDNSIELRNTSNNSVFDFQEDNSFYIKTGIRFKI